MENRYNIIIRGARHHNLKNLDLELPKNKLVVITGVSGSGKSTLAFDTIYAEGQRRYIESLSTYARQYLRQMKKPEVDLIEGLAPAISIEQRTTTPSPRSTVGTITEILDYLRLLYSRVGQPYCPTHQKPLSIQTIAEIVNEVLTNFGEQRILIAVPISNKRVSREENVIDKIRSAGFVRVIADGVIYELDDEVPIKKIHTLDIIIDRLVAKVDNRQRLVDSIEIGEESGSGKIKILDASGKLLANYSTIYACPDCSYSPPPLTPKLFSFNNPVGACEKCNGLGKIQFFDPDKIVGVPELSLSSGAIDGWDRRNEFYHRLLRDLANHYRFDLDTPFNKLDKNVQTTILYGSDDEKIKFSFLNRDGKIRHEKRPFEGIIPNFQKKLEETRSSAIKEKLINFQSKTTCPECSGTRLCTDTRHVLINKFSIDKLCKLTLSETLSFFSAIPKKTKNLKIGAHIIEEITKRLSFLVDVGVDYLTLDRSASSISGGEHQRIRLASQIGSGLTGVIYVLDEPSIGLHERDNMRLINTLKILRDSGNTVLVVEHDLQTMRASDHIVDIGPGAGAQGGELIAAGSPKEVAANKNSITGKYLSQNLKIDIPSRTNKPDWKKRIRIENATGNNLRGISVDIPIGLLVCITGVSGSGKSTLVHQTLYRSLMNHFYKSKEKPSPCGGIYGLEWLDKVVEIDQRPIGRTPRSNPATYVGLYGPIRELFSNLKLARERGYTAGRFSFNSKGGRCEGCQGAGLKKVEMHFLPDVHVQCEICKGRRFNPETLEISYRGKNIYDVLNMTVDNACIFFSAVPDIKQKLVALSDVGLGYIKIGQSATTLSGGEAQRVKLASELSKNNSGKTIYILDEPTTGLHLEDIKNLLKILEKLRKQGNTILVVEHNLEVIKTADWLIDLGPEGGDRGGQINLCGTPKDVAKQGKGHTSMFLRTVLNPPQD